MDAAKQRQGLVMNAPAIDSAMFRKVLGHYPTGVCVITAMDEESRPLGMVVGSFTSVSLDPPLVLWSLARTSRSFDAFCAADHFAIHVLTGDQEDLAIRFASRGEDKFAGLAVADGVGGAPLLGQCATRLQCRTVARHDGGDHLIFIGQVERFDHCDGEPLLFHQGRFGRIAAPAERQIA